MLWSTCIKCLCEDVVYEENSYRICGCSNFFFFSLLHAVLGGIFPVVALKCAHAVADVKGAVGSDSIEYEEEKITSIFPHSSPGNTSYASWLAAFNLFFVLYIVLYGSARNFCTLFYTHMQL